MKKKIIFVSLVGLLVLAGAGCQGQRAPEIPPIAPLPVALPVPAPPAVVGPDEQPLPVGEMIVTEDRGNVEEGETDITIEPQPAPAEIKLVEMQITAKQWGFVPSQIKVRKGDRVRLTITSADVAHGFSLSEFGVGLFVDGGKTVTVEFVADKVGIFSFFCSVPCGSGHGSMRGTFIVE